MKSLKVLCGLSVAMALQAAEPEIQTVESIRQAIGAYLESIVRQYHQNFDIEVPPLDSRLHLPRCDQPLAVFLLREAIPAGAVSVGVECQAGHPWTIYAKANIRVFQPVAVLARPLPKDTVLDQEMVTLKLTDIATLRQGYFVDIDSVLGQRLKGSLPAGTVLTPHLLESVNLVSKGDAVVLRVSAGALDVRMGGHALMDGKLGQKILVRNDRSQKVVEGVVQGPGEVQVAF